MKLIKLCMYFSVLSSASIVCADTTVADNDYDTYDEHHLQSQDPSQPAFYDDWTADDLRFASGMGGGGGGGRGRGWGGNPFKWSSGPRTWYNPFSWGNPAAVPVTTVVPGGDDDLDAQIDAANRRAKKLEFLLAKQRQLKALQELNQQGGGAGGGGSDAP